MLAKLLVTGVAILVAALARPAGALPRPVVLVGLAWAGCFTVAALLGDTPLASLLGRWPRYEGLPTLVLYAGSCWVGARVVGRGPSAVARLTGAVGAMALVLAAFSALDLAGFSPLGPSTEARTGSLLGNATDQGSVAMMAALVLVGAVLPSGRSGQPRESGGRSLLGFRVVALAAAVATVGMSGSRAALVLTALGVLVAVVPARARAVPTAWWGGAGSVVLLGAVALLVPSTRSRLLSPGSAEGRWHQWRLTLDLVLDHPLVGLGGSRYVDAFLGYEDADFVDFTGPQRLADSPHSVVLQVLVAGGLLLLAASVLVAVVVGRRAVTALAEHPEARPAAVAVAAYVVLACANFTTAGPTCLAALLLGVVVAVPSPAGEVGRRHAPAAAVGGVLALAVATASVGSVQLQRGVTAADAGQAQRAVDRFDDATRWRGWDADTRLIAARVLAEAVTRGQASAAAPAEALARGALERVPDSYEALVALGISLSAQGRVGEAAAVLDRAVALAPERPDGYVQRAIARAGLGRVADALVDLRRAQEIVPGSTVVRRLLRQVGAR